MPVTYVVFDVLRIDGTDLTGRAYSERRDLLVSLDLRGQWWVTTAAFDDGPALYAAVCAHGLEGVVAKKLSSRYAPGERGWIKLKNPTYWRRDAERDAMVRKHERRTQAVA